MGRVCPNVALLQCIIPNPIPIAEAPVLTTPIVNPKKLETGLRTISAKVPDTLLFRIEAIGFPTFGLLLYEPRSELLIQPGYRPVQF